MDHLGLERLWLLELLLMKLEHSSSWLMVWKVFFFFFFWWLMCVASSVVCLIIMTIYTVMTSFFFFAPYSEKPLFQFCYLYFSRFRIGMSLFWQHLVNFDLIGQLFYFWFRISPPVCTAFILSWIKLFQLEKSDKEKLSYMLRNSLKTSKCW